MVVFVVLDVHLLVVVALDGHHARFALVQSGAGARPVRSRRSALVLGERVVAHLQLSAAAKAFDEREVVGCAG